MRPSGRRVALIAAALVLTAGVGTPLAVGAALVRPARGAVGPPPGDLRARTVAFPSASGAMLRGWFVPGRPGAGAVLLMHGLRSDRRSMADRARFLHRAGYTVLLFDFQAHGESSGDRITFGAREGADARAALAYLRSHAPGERVGAMGVSLGGAAALLAEPPLALDGLVLESVYPTIEQATADRLAMRLGRAGRLLAPLLIWQLGPRLGVAPAALRPVERIGAVGEPVLVIAGTADRHTTLAESRALYARARPPKEFWAVPGAAHVDLHAFAGAEYERRVLAFFGRYLARAG